MYVCERERMCMCMGICYSGLLHVVFVAYHRKGFIGITLLNNIS